MFHLFGKLLAPCWTGNCSSGRKSKQCDPGVCHLLLCKCVREKEREWEATVLCLCAKGRGRGSACPLMRTCVVFHISHPAPMGPSLVQRSALAFQIRCTIPFDNKERKSNMCCWDRLGQWGLGLGNKNLFWIRTIAKFLKNKVVLRKKILISLIHSWQPNVWTYSTVQCFRSYCHCACTTAHLNKTFNHCDK